MADFQSGKYQQAYEGFLKLQKIQPDNFELFIASGQALQSMGKAQQALDEYNKAVSLQGGQGPRAWEPYYRMAELLNQAGDKVQAFGAYKHALNLAPGETQLYISRGQLYQARIPAFRAAYCAFAARSPPLRRAAAASSGCTTERGGAPRAAEHGPVL
jgi:tetratricopeptide (TPR) repeat protein